MVDLNGWSLVFTSAFATALLCENKSVNRSSACTVWHSFCFLFFEILSRCEPRKIQKQKKNKKNEPSCSVKVAQGWENENGFPPLTGLQLLGFGVQKADQLRWTCQEGRQEKDCFFFFFLFDAAVIISWVCETQRRLKCPLMACLISEWQFCQLGLDWSLCLRAICFLQVTKKRLNTPVTK